MPTDGVLRRQEAGAVLQLDPGESVTLMPGVWHAFWGEGGDVLIGEVSTVNDDLTDNIFAEPIGRFAEIEEDEAPLHLLVSDYDALVRMKPEDRMAESDRVFAGSIPALYDTYLVPLIFEAHAADLARRVAAGSPRAVLETAAGSGVVARALAPLLPPDATYVVSDLNQPMLDRAAGGRTPTRGSNGGRRTRWRCRSPTDGSTRSAVSSG